MKSRPASASDLSRAGGHVAATLAREYWEALENPRGKTLSAILRDHPESMGLLNDFQKFKVRQYLTAMARWYGWLKGHSQRLAEWPLLLGSVLESDKIDDTHRAWARRCNLAPERLLALGDAPSWVVRGEGYRRLVGSSRANVDPWSLLPGWLRGHLPDTPTDESSKTWHAKILEGFQFRPYKWVRLRDVQKNRTIDDTLEKLEEQTGQSAWRARKLPSAVRWPAHMQLPEARDPWAWIVQDFSHQVTASVCDPDPGERWCLIEPRDLSVAIDLADRMKGKGVVVVASANERLLRAAAQLARRCGCHNVTTRTMSGTNLPGKPAIYDGVLVDTHGMGMDRWRSHPEMRLRCVVSELKPIVAEIDVHLRSALKALKTGGRLVYAVGSLTVDETDLVADRLAAKIPGLTPLEFVDPRNGRLGPPRMHFWPERDWGEALFLARWTKTSPLKSEERKGNVFAVEANPVKADDSDIVVPEAVEDEPQAPPHTDTEP
jgi:16S rRNA (cytosine967-C5)-methyltransferase